MIVSYFIVYVIFFCGVCIHILYFDQRRCCLLFFLYYISSTNRISVVLFACCIIIYFNVFIVSYIVSSVFLPDVGINTVLLFSYCYMICYNEANTFCIFLLPFFLCVRISFVLITYTLYDLKHRDPCQLYLLRHFNPGVGIHIVLI